MKGLKAHLHNLLLFIITAIAFVTWSCCIPYMMHKMNIPSVLLYIISSFWLCSFAIANYDMKGR